MNLFNSFITKFIVKRFGSLVRPYQTQRYIFTSNYYFHFGSYGRTKHVAKIQTILKSCVNRTKC